MTGKRPPLAMSIVATPHASHLPVKEVERGDVIRLRRLAPPVKKNRNLAWVPLVDEEQQSSGSTSEPTHTDIRRMDKKRKTLLKLARSTSALDTLIRFRQLPRTVLPRLMKRPLVYAFVLAYMAGAILTRYEYMSLKDVEEAAKLSGELQSTEPVRTRTHPALSALIGSLETYRRVRLHTCAGNTGGQMVTFIVVFYVGYCYNRSSQQFDDVQLIMHAINDACLSARVAFHDSDEIHRIWRYLNLLHASAYCGLTEELSAQNFFLPVADKFGLFGEGKEREEEVAALERVDLDAHGSRACSMFEVWAFEVVKGEGQRTAQGEGDLYPPIQARLQAEINTVGVCIKRLFAYRYQVMPFIYTHLVSLACFIYLITEAFLSGITWVPGSSVTFGLVVPLILVLAKIISTFGLIEVGETILDPFGTDPEDFAILHFVEVTVCSSFEAINIEPCGPRHKDREAFYTDEQLAAAKILVKRLITRYRWQRMMRQAGSEAALKRNVERARAKRTQQFIADMAAKGSISGSEKERLARLQARKLQIAEGSRSGDHDGARGGGGGGRAHSPVGRRALQRSMGSRKGADMHDGHVTSYLEARGLSVKIGERRKVRGRPPTPDVDLKHDASRRRSPTRSPTPEPRHEPKRDTSKHVRGRDKNGGDHDRPDSRASLSNGLKASTSTSIRHGRETGLSQRMAAPDRDVLITPSGSGFSTSQRLEA